MTDADKPEFLRILTGLAAIKPGGKLTPEALSVWWLAMQDWPMDQFRAAAGQLASSVEFMPSPYHFAQLRKATQDTAGEAWSQVLEAVRTMNPHVAPSLGARIDRVVRALGGYRTLAMTDSSAMPFREKRFAELWEELGEAEEARAVLPFYERPKLTAGPNSADKLLSRGVA
jgi:hypothetical protein